MNIKLSELQAVADRLFAHLRETGREEFDVTDDYYWDISKDELYEPRKDPGDLTMGQLSHDWERLQAVLGGEDPPIGHSLVWLSAILRNVGENNVY